MGLPAQTIPFGEWLPDLPPYENPGALEALNVVPLTASYGPLRSLQPFGTALNTAARGLFWLKDNAGDVHNFAADTSRLYKLGSDANTWNDVSKVTDYTSTMQWEFLKFGERVIALNGADAIQYFDLGSSTDFADLPGSPPVAKHAGVVRDFIVTGNLTDEPNVLQWSGFNSSELWTPSRATQADKQTLFGRGGDIQRIVPGEYGVVLQEHSIYRMDYATAGITFQISEIERGRGTPAPGSVCWLGTSVFYFGYDGFYMFDGQQSLPLSTNKVSQWFQANADSAGLASMCGTVDRENQLVIWAFKTNALSAANDSLIIYNWGSQRWSHAMLETEYISEYASPPIGIDPTDRSGYRRRDRYFRCAVRQQY